MKYLKTKVVLARMLELIFSIGAMFLLFIQYNLDVILISSALSFVFIFIYDFLLIKKQEEHKLKCQKEHVYIINRVPYLNIQLIFSLLFYAVVFLVNLSPFVDIIWFLIPWAIFKYVSKRINISNNDGYFLVLEKDKIVKHLENESCYEYSELMAIKVKDDKLLVNTGIIPISIPTYLRISSTEKEKMKLFFEENAKGIYAKF